MFKNIIYIKHINLVYKSYFFPYLRPNTMRGRTVQEYYLCVTIFYWELILYLIGVFFTFPAAHPPT